MYDMHAQQEEDILKYLPLVEKAVDRIGVKNIEYTHDDLFNIGVIGLMDALHKFDASKKVPFENYALIRIRGAIIDEVRKTSRLSRYKMMAVNRYYQIKQQLEQELMREVTDTELCQALSINHRQLNDIYDSIHFLASVSLESTLFQEGDDQLTLGDTLQDQTPSVEDDLLATERKTVLLKGIKQLSEREQLVLSLYYEQELTLKEISQVLDVSVARVSQIHGKLISKLKTYIEEELHDTRA